MSRSYKKHPVIKDGGSSKKFWKRLSNNVVKQHDLPSGSAYKRLVNPYNFCDYKWSMLGEFRDNWYYNPKCKYHGNYDADMFECRRK